MWTSEKADRSGKSGWPDIADKPQYPLTPAFLKSKVEAVPGVTEVAVELTFDPPWTTARMSEAAQLQLGVYPVDSVPRVTRFGV